MNLKLSLCLIVLYSTSRPSYFEAICINGQAYHSLMTHMQVSLKYTSCHLVFKSEVEVKSKLVPAVISQFYNTALGFVGACNQLTRLAPSPFHFHILTFLHLNSHNTILAPIFLLLL